MQVVKQSIIHFTRRITMTSKTLYLKTVDGKKAIPNATLKELGTAGLKKAKAFAGRNKAALIAARVTGAGAAGYALGRRKSGDE
jgi:hypothetical protein